MIDLLSNYRENLSEASTHSKTIRYKLAKGLLDKNFQTWIAKNQALVRTLIKDAKQGKLNSDEYICYQYSQPFVLQLEVSPVNRMNFSQTLAPPMPQHSEKSGKKTNAQFGLSATTKSMVIQFGSSDKKKQKQQETGLIDQFYFPKGRPLEPEQQAINKNAIQSLFETKQLGYFQFRNVLKQISCLPPFFASLVFKKLNKTAESNIAKVEFIKFWKNQLQSKDVVKRAYHLLASSAQGIKKEDFKPIMLDILNYHKGLQFLKATPEFQQKYSDTVILRIFYKVNLKDDGKISLRELKMSKLLQTMEQLQQESDTNNVADFFSYSDFYVIFCKFWDLDSDRNNLISKQEFSKYSSHGLSRKAIDRIYSHIPRSFKSESEKMNYEDFLYFILCQEDKSTRQSVQYWFRIVDLDNNGVIAGYQLQYFFQEQSQRMLFFNKEMNFSFQNLICEMSDLLKPANQLCFRLQDFLRDTKSSGVFFSILTNINKLLAYEQRDPHQIRNQSQQHPNYTEWDRFSKMEYQRLEQSTQNEGQEVDVLDNDDL